MTAFPDTLKFPGQTLIDSLVLWYTKIAKLTTFICITTVNNDFVCFKNEPDFDDLAYITKLQFVQIGYYDFGNMIYTFWHHVITNTLFLCAGQKQNKQDHRN